MPDLVLPDFPTSLIERVDAYIALLEDLNPGVKWTRSSAISTLVSRGLAEVEGAERRWSRRRGKDRRSSSRGNERRGGPPDRRSAPYPEMVDLVIEHILRRQFDSSRPRDETWHDRHGSGEA